MVGTTVKEKDNGRIIIRHHSVPLHPSAADRRTCVNDPEWECDSCLFCRNYPPYDEYDERKRDAEREERQ